MIIIKGKHESVIQSWNAYDECGLHVPMMLLHIPLVYYDYLYLLDSLTSIITVFMNLDSQISFRNNYGYKPSYQTMLNLLHTCLL